MPEKQNAPSTEVSPTLFLKTLTKCILLFSVRIVFMPEKQNKRSTAFSKAKEI